MTKQHITLSSSDESHLRSLLNQGALPSRIYRRVFALLELHKGSTIEAVSTRIEMKRDTVSRWAKRYRSEGLNCLHDRPKSGRPVTLSGEFRAKVTALACSEAPEGRSSWTLRLLADRVVELGWCDQVSHTQIGNILKKTNSSLT